MVMQNFILLQAYKYSLCHKCGLVRNVLVSKQASFIRYNLKRLISVIFLCWLKYPYWSTFYITSRLLDILATRKDPAGLSGDILINGYRLPSHFKCISGYVVQVNEVSSYCIKSPALVWFHFLTQAN